MHVPLPYLLNVEVMKTLGVSVAYQQFAPCTECVQENRCVMESEVNIEA